MMAGLKVTPEQKKNIVPSAIGIVIGATVAETLSQAIAAATKLSGMAKVVVAIVVKGIIGVVFLGIGAMGKFPMVFTMAGYAAFGSIAFDIIGMVLGLSGGGLSLSKVAAAKIMGVSKTYKNIEIERRTLSAGVHANATEGVYGGDSVTDQTQDVLQRLRAERAAGVVE